MLNNEVVLSSGVVSTGMMALADYVSSPSSTGSWMFYDIPELLISTGGRTQRMGDEEDEGREHSTRLIWLKKPYRS